MRLVHFDDAKSGIAAGVALQDHSVVPLSAALGPAAPTSVAATLADLAKLRPRIYARLDDIAADRDTAFERGWLIPAEQVTLRAPVGDRQLIVCAGGNYRAHVAEFGEEPPKNAPSFVKSPSAVIGPGEAIVLPSHCPDMVDYEGEICVVFGNPCHAVTADEAMRYVAGFTILNDVSARDLMTAMLTSTGRDAQWSLVEMLMGKQFPTFAPIGPAVVTADEITDPAALQLTTTINDEVMQDATTAELVVDIPHLIAAMSRYYAFRPGDLLSTGSPAGVGAGRTPPVFLGHGDVVSISVGPIGTLTNGVRASADVLVA